MHPPRYSAPSFRCRPSAGNPLFEVVDVNLPSFHGFGRLLGATHLAAIAAASRNSKPHSHLSAGAF